MRTTFVIVFGPLMQQTSQVVLRYGNDSPENGPHLAFMYVTTARAVVGRVCLKTQSRAFAIHKRRDTLAASTLYQYQCDLQRRVHRCLALEPVNPHGRRLQKRYTKIQDHLFLFLDDVAIPPTTNASEQAIRMSTVFRKVTNGFRSAWGRDLFAAVRSVVNTGKRHGLSAFQAIQKALSPVGSLFEPG